MDIDSGIAAATSVLLATNAAIDREERTDAMAELGERVEDWKGHRLESFGDLLLHGTYQVIKGDTANPKDQEREVSPSTLSSRLEYSDFSVQNISLRDDTAMLQGDEPQQAK
jgi:hypothetical protein